MSRWSAAFFGVMVLLVLSFASWGTRQALEVRDIRRDLERQVGWLITLQSATPALSALPDVAAAEEWAALQPAIEETLDDIDAFGGPGTAVARRAVASAADDTVGAVEALSALQGDIRGLNRQISIRLAQYWSVLNVLLLASVLLSLASLGLLFLLLRRKNSLARANAALSAESRQRQHTADSLKSSEQALSVLLESIDEGIITVDGGGRITRMNAAAERLTGSRRSVAGAPLSQVLQLRTPQDPVDLSTERLRAGLSLYGADGVRLRRNNGLWCPVALRSAPLGEGPGALLLIRDITREESIEQERRKSERTGALSRLIAGVSHQLNNPLTTLQEGIQRLSSETDPAPLLSQLRSEVARMVGVLRQLSALSQVTPRAIERLDPGPLLIQVARILDTEIKQRARLVLDVKPTAEILADRARFEQALLGVIFGAVQAIPEGSPEEHTITITARMCDGQVEVCVEDTGEGLGGVDEESVFDPLFFARTVNEGTGLTYARAEIVALSGTLAVESPASGTRIRIVLPPAAEEDAPALPGGLRVLVIDDEAAILSVVRRMLRGQYETIATASAREGLQLLRAGDYDVALCDLMMPGMTGMRLHATLAEEHPELAARMAFMTGGAFNDRSRAFLHAHQQVSLSKPFSHEELLEVLGRAVARATAG